MIPTPNIDNFSVRKDTGPVPPGAPVKQRKDDLFAQEIAGERALADCLRKSGMSETCVQSVIRYMKPDCCKKLEF